MARDPRFVRGTPFGGFFLQEPKPRLNSGRTPIWGNEVFPGGRTRGSRGGTTTII